MRTFRVIMVAVYVCLLVHRVRWASRDYGKEQPMKLHIFMICWWAFFTCFEVYILMTAED